VNVADFYVLASVRGGQGPFIVNVEADQNGNTIYYGWAKQGSLDSDKNWTICKNLYDSNGYFSGDRLSIPNVRWTERGATTYS
jgi:hypothetical protein